MTKKRITLIEQMGYDAYLKRDFTSYVRVNMLCGRRTRKAFMEGWRRGERALIKMTISSQYGKM